MRKKFLYVVIFLCLLIIIGYCWWRWTRLPQAAIADGSCYTITPVRFEEGCSPDDLQASVHLFQDDLRGFADHGYSTCAVSVHIVGIGGAGCNLLLIKEAANGMLPFALANQLTRPATETEIGYE